MTATEERVFPKITDESLAGLRSRRGIPAIRGDRREADGERALFVVRRVVPAKSVKPRCGIHVEPGLAVDMGERDDHLVGSAFEPGGEAAEVLVNIEGVEDAAGHGFSVNGKNLEAAS